MLQLEHINFIHESVNFIKPPFRTGVFETKVATNGMASHANGFTLVITINILR